MTRGRRDGEGAARKRKPVSKRTRFEVFKRDRFTCQYCGSKPPEVVLHLDHIVPVVEGGSNDTTNLVTSCQDCNLGKSDVPLGEVRPVPSADTLAAMVEGREQLAAYQDFLLDERKTRQAQADFIAEQVDKQMGVNVTVSRHRDIDRMLRDLTYVEMLDAIDITLQRGHYYSAAWSYFCGICWTKIRAAKNRVSTYDQMLANKQQRGEAN